MTFARSLFDAVSGGYDERPPFFQTLGRELVDRAALPAGARVADLGAGKGAVTLALRAVAGIGHLTCVDISSAMLSSIKGLGLDDVMAVQADLAALPFAEHAFDHAVSGFTLHILNDSQQAAGEIYRTLRPAGTLTWSMPGAHPDAADWAQEYGTIYAEFIRRLDAPPAEMTPTEPAERAFERAGFTTIESAAVPVSIPVGDAEDYWTWTQSHGVRWLSDALPARDAAELHDRVVDSLVRLHPTQGATIMVAPQIFRMRRS